MKGFKNATMLYRKGHAERIHGVHVETIIVDEHEVDEHLADGWFRTPSDVKAAADEAAKEAAEAAEAAAAKKPAPEGKKLTPDKQ